MDAGTIAKDYDENKARIVLFSFNDVTHTNNAPRAERRCKIKAGTWKTPMMSTFILRLHPASGFLHTRKGEDLSLRLSFSLLISVCSDVIQYTLIGNHGFFIELCLILWHLVSI